MANRVGAILAVRDFERSVAFYRDAIGFEVEALYEDPPYATLTLAGARLSLAERGHPADDRPGGCGFSCVDHDGYLIEIEQVA